MRRISLLLALTLGAGLPMLAAAEGKGPPPSDYARFAGEPVNSIQFASIYGWEPIDEEHLVLYTGVRKAWMLDLSGLCMQSLVTIKINVTSAGNRIHSGFDKVQTREGSCRITQIRKIDMEAFDEARRQLQGGDLELGNATDLLAADPVEREKE